MKPLSHRLTYALALSLTVWAPFAGGRIAGQAPPAPVGAQTAPAAMPIDLAFGRTTLARENPIALSADGTLAAYVVHTPPEKSPRDSRYLPTGVPVSTVGSSVFVSPTSGGEPYAAAPDGGNCWRPSFAPDGKRLAFYCDKGGTPQLWMHDLTTRQSRMVSTTPIKAKLWIGDEPLWSPDGRVVYVPLAPKAPTPPAETATPPPGPSVTVHRSDPALQPTGASSDDRVEVDHFMRENNAALGAIDARTGAVRVIVPADAVPAPSVLRVSPTGSWIAYLSVFHKPRALDSAMFHDLAVVPSEGGAVRRIAANLRVPSGGYHIGTYVWHPTGDQLFWVQGAGLWTVDLSEPNAAPRRLAPDLNKIASAPIAMTRDGGAVLIGVEPVDMRDYRDPYPQALALVPIEGGATRTIRVPDGITFQGAIMASHSVLWQRQPPSSTRMSTTCAWPW